MNTHTPLRNIALAIIAGATLLTPGTIAQPLSPEERAKPVEAPDRQELTQMLKDRLEQLEAIRLHINETLKNIEAGGEPPFPIDPSSDRWLMSRLREGGRRPGRDTGRELDRMPDLGPKTDETISSADLDEIRGLITENMPLMAERLRTAEKMDPESAERFLSRIAPRFRDVLRLKREAPELVEIRLDEMRTGMAIVGAARELRRLQESDPESEALGAKREEIRTLLSRQFDLRHKLERHRLETMAKDLEAATSRLDTQQSKRDEIIEDHFERVLSRAFSDGPRGDGPPNGDRPRRQERRRNDRPKP